MSRTKAVTPTSSRLRRVLAATGAAALASGAILFGAQAAQASSFLFWNQPGGPVAADATLTFNVGPTTTGPLNIFCDGNLRGYAPNLPANSTQTYPLTSCGALSPGQHTMSLRTGSWGSETLVITVSAPEALAPAEPSLLGSRFDGRPDLWVLPIRTANGQPLPAGATFEVLVDGQDASTFGTTRSSDYFANYVRFPFDSLSRGDHEVSVTQINADGKRSPAHVETFGVGYPNAPVVTVDRTAADNGKVTVTLPSGYTVNDYMTTPAGPGQVALLDNFRTSGAEGLSIRITDPEGFASLETVVYPGDTDNDLLGDHDEALLGTHPAKSETDGDSYKDGVEVAAGFDPLNAASHPGKVGPAPVVRLHAPSAPRSSAATAGAKGGKTTASVHWVGSLTDNGAPVTKYRVAATKLDARNRAVKVYQADYVGASIRTATMNLPAGRYEFRVRSWNKVGMSAWSTPSNRVVAQ